MVDFVLGKILTFHHVHILSSFYFKQDITVKVPSPPMRSPEFASSYFSHFLFLWVNPLFVAGNDTSRPPLSSSDLFPLSDIDDPSLVSSKFEELL